MMNWKPINIDKWLRKRPFWSDVLSQTLAGLAVSGVALFLGGLVAMAALGSGSISVSFVLGYTGLSAFVGAAGALMVVSLQLCNRGDPLIGSARTNWSFALAVALVLVFSALGFTDISGAAGYLLVGVHLIALFVGVTLCGRGLGGLRLTRMAFAAGAMLGLSAAVWNAIFMGVVIARATRGE